jgi:eukaryotic-like serine/threonine-protein kinase
MNSRWEKIEEGVAVASEMPLAARPAWLAEFCGDDSELRSEIESLLAFESEAESFLEKSADSYAARILPLEDATTSVAGKQFGRYRILREIGRGGMGTVFLAERTDGEFEQQVALKIVRQTILDAESEKRFRRERQILASLNHPNIAKLLDGGVSENGEPFLVMEYIAGAPAPEFIRKHKLEIEERLRLFLKICRAVAFAHRNLVVHRDIKPSNVLVTEEGEPKLLDFGLAKILNESLDDQTRTVLRAMTPAYASPEQARGDAVTTASDIYSLGVVFYELLKNKRFAERPSHFLTHKPKTELDAIILTALDEEPERRYKSVEAFAEDIERFLNKKTIKARPNTFSYRAAKFIRRNKYGVAAAALILLVLVGGVTTTLWQVNVARTERDRAEKRFNDVRKLSTSLLFEISPKIERLPSSTEARQTIVRRALEYLDSLATEAAEDELLQSELASAYEKVGDVQFKNDKPNLGDLRGATESYLKAQNIRLRLVAKYPNDFETERQLAANRYAIGEIRWWSSDVDGALENFRQANEIYEKLARRQPENLDINLDVVRARLAEAKVLSFNGKRQESIEIYRRMIARLENLKQNHPPHTELVKLLGDSHLSLAYDLSWENQMAEADREAAAAFAIYEPLLAADPNDTRLNRSLWYANFMAAGIFEDADPARSRAYLDKSIALAQRASEADRLDVQAKHDLAQSYSKLGVIATNQQKFDEAVQFLAEAQKILDELAAAEPRHAGYKFNIANNFTRLGEAQDGKGDHAAALKSFEKAFALQTEMRRADGGDNMPIRAIAISSQRLAQIYEKLREYEKAASFNEKGLEMLSVLKQKDALSEYDKKTVEDLQNALKSCQEKKRQN